MASSAAKKAQGGGGHPHRRWRLSGQVRTTGTIAFNTSVRLLADSVVDSTGGLGVFFARDVDTANSATERSLTVLTRRNTTSTAKNIPTIKFGGSIGANRALGNLNLNFDSAQMIDGRANVRRARRARTFREAFSVAAYAGCFGALASMMLGDWILPFAYNETISGFDHACVTWIFLGCMAALARMDRAPAQPVAASREAR